MDILFICYSPTHTVTAHIRDGTTGAFAGTIVGLDYGWQNATAGVEIHDYNAAADGCSSFEGCFPGGDGGGSRWSNGKHRNIMS